MSVYFRVPFAIESAECCAVSESSKMSGLKRKVLTLDDKVAVIKAVESGAKKADVCRQFSLVNSTVCTILKNKDKILENFNNGKGHVKKVRLCEKADIDSSLLEWFKQCRAANLPINGPLLKEKAEEFGRLLGQDFSCSNGWLDRFKQRHSINFGKVSGEAKSVSVELTEEWVKEKWPKIREGYADSEIYNADETGIFFKLLPDKTLKFKGEKCTGGKLAKDRLTVLLCANMNGTDKRKPLVIGKSQKPRCFKNVKTLPVQYHANKKSWMTSSIFEEEIRKWDKELMGTQKKVLLIIDNCPAHPTLNNLKKIKIVFLPANCTSVLQPLDQGIIRSFKCHYRKFVLRKVITAMDAKQNYSISVLDAVEFMAKAWRKVSQQTIVNCFRHAQLSISQEQSDENNEDEDEDIPLAELIRRLAEINEVHFDDTIVDEYENIDNDLQTVEFSTDKDIVEQIQAARDNIGVENNTDNEEESPLGEDEVPSNSDVLNAIKVLKTFYRQRDTPLKVMEKINDLENDIQTIFLTEKRKQTKITDFFAV